MRWMDGLEVEGGGWVGGGVDGWVACSKHYFWKYSHRLCEYLRQNQRTGKGERTRTKTLRGMVVGRVMCGYSCSHMAPLSSATCLPVLDPKQHGKAASDGGEVHQNCSFYSQLCLENGDTSDKGNDKICHACLTRATSVQELTRENTR